MKVINNRTLGILLIVAAILIFIPIPLVDEKTIAAIIVLIIGLYQLMR